MLQVRPVASALLVLLADGVTSPVVGGGDDRLETHPGVILHRHERENGDRASRFTSEARDDARKSALKHTCQVWVVGALFHVQGMYTITGVPKNGCEFCEGVLPTRNKVKDLRSRRTIPGLLGSLAETKFKIDRHTRGLALVVGVEELGKTWGPMKLVLGDNSPTTFGVLLEFIIENFILLPFPRMPGTKRLLHFRDKERPLEVVVFAAYISEVILVVYLTD